MSNYHNLAQRTNWIGGSDSFEHVPFYLTSVNIPGISMSHPEIGGRAATLMSVPADNIDYNSLVFEMLIDEDFEIFKEMMGIVKKGINVETGNFGTFDFDFWLQLNNSKGNRVMKLDFKNCRISSVGDIELNTQDETTEYTMSVEIIFDYYDIEDNPHMTLITT